MKIETIKTLYFSPTGTTRKVVEAIARGASPRTTQSIDLTLPAAITEKLLTLEDDLIIVGLPVYVGRIPAEAI